MSAIKLVHEEDVLDKFRRCRPPHGSRWREGWRTLAHQVVRHEGVVLEGYRCPAGKLTIGCGHLVKKGEPYKLGFRFSAEHLADVFAHDLAEHLDLGIEWVGEECWRDLPNAIRLLVGGMAFNLGGQLLTDWQGTAGRIRRGDWDEVARKLERAKWYDQVKDRSKRLVGMAWVASLGIDVELRRG